jgi:predicted ATPase with chaperone activity
MDDSWQALMKTDMRTLQLTALACHPVLKLSRRIADL